MSVTKNAAKVKRLWASVHHSPAQVLTFMDKLSERNFNGKLKAQIIMPEDVRTSNFSQKAHIWIVVSSFGLDLLAQKKVDMSKSTVVLIENAAVATQYSGIKLLDCTQIKSYQFKFKPLDSELVLSLRESIDEEPFLDLTRAKVDIIPELLNAQPPSILNPVMTFAYTIPDTDKRTKYLVDIFQMIRSQGSIEDIKWFNPDNKRMAELRDWLESKIGRLAMVALSNALNKVKSSDGGDEFRELAEEFDVAKFDINYAVEFIKRTQVSHPDLDTRTMFAIDENRAQEES